MRSCNRLDLISVFIDAARPVLAEMHLLAPEGRGIITLLHATKTGSRRGAAGAACVSSAGIADIGATTETEAVGAAGDRSGTRRRTIDDDRCNDIDGVAACVDVDCYFSVSLTALPRRQRMPKST